MRPGEGITGAAAAAREPIMIAEKAHLDARFKAFQNLPEDEYESILAVPILARDKLAGALNVRTRAPRAFSPAEVDLLLAIAAQVAQTIEHAKLYREARRRVGELEALARISEAVSESLYLEESLEAIVKTTMEAVGRDRCRAGARGREDRVARGPFRCVRGAASAALEAEEDRRARLRPRHALHRRRARPAGSIAHHAAVALEHGRAVMRGVLAQEIHHRVKNNLQTVASLLRLQARSADAVNPRKALDDSVNRILAIAAVHEVLTEHRDDDVELAELVDRLRAMLVQGLGAAKQVETELEPVSLAGNRATALALVFSELFQNALEHGGGNVRIELSRRNGERPARDLRRRRRARTADAREPGCRSCVRWCGTSCRDRCGSRDEGGLRAEVVFSAA